jgi:hypothetical protein
LVDELETHEGLFTLTCTARGDKLRTQNIGANALGADFAARHWMKGGKRWWTACFPALTKHKQPF